MSPSLPADDPVPEHGEFDSVDSPDTDQLWVSFGVRDVSKQDCGAELLLLSVVWWEEGPLVSGQFMESEFVYEAGEAILAALEDLPGPVVLELEGHRLARYVEKRADAGRVEIVGVDRNELNELDDALALALSHACIRSGRWG